MGAGQFTDSVLRTAFISTTVADTPRLCWAPISELMILLYWLTKACIDVISACVTGMLFVQTLNVAVARFGTT